MSSTDLAGRPRARPDLELGEVTGWTFVFDRTARRLHRLNPTAATVFGLLDGTVSTDELTRVVARGYHTDPAGIEGDIRAIVDEFAGEGLLVGAALTVAPDQTVRGSAPTGSRLEARLSRLLTERAGTTDLGSHRAMGFRFRVLVDDHDSVDGLRAILAPLARADAEGPEAAPFGSPPLRTYHLRAPSPGTTLWRLNLDATRIHQAHDSALAIDHLLWHLNRMAVLTCADDTVFHAGAASDGRGAVLLPGESNAGKSTLVTGLVADGIDYLSDEAILLDRDDRAWPYPKAIDLDPGSWPLFPELRPPEREAGLHRVRWHVPSERIRLGAEGVPTPVRAIVSPRYEQDATPHLEPFAPEDTFGLLLEQAFHVGGREGAIDQVARLVETVPCHRVVSGTVEGAVALVREVLASA